MPSVAMMKFRHWYGTMLSCGWLPPEGNSACAFRLQFEPLALV